MNEKEKTVSGGMGLTTILFLIFLVLKLTGHITWSWWWVTSPLWIPWVFVGGILLLILVICFVVVVVKHMIEKMGK